MKNRAQGAAALLNNMATAEAALQTANNSSGSALKENEKYLNSIDGRISVLKANFQNLWSNAIDSSIIKFFIDLGTSILKIVDNVGLLNTAIGAFTVVASLKGAGGTNKKQLFLKLKMPAISCAMA